MTPIVKIASLLAISFSSLFSPIQEQTIYVTVDKFGPFYRNQDARVNIKLESKSRYEDLIVDLYYNIDANDDYFLVASSGYIDIEPNVVTITDIKVPTYLFQHFNPINFEIRVTRDATYQFLTTIPFRLYEGKDYQIDIQTLKNSESNYTPPRTTISILKNEVFYRDSDQLSFKRFSESFVEEYYHRLTFGNKFFFNYYSKANIIYDDIFLIFNDKENLFPYLADDTRTVKIRLKAIQSGTNYIHTLALNEEILFVNPTTLQMSRTKRNNYVKTNYFYLPVNGKSLFETYDLIIYFKGLGQGGFDYYYLTNYMASKSIIGNCSSSQFCIVGGIYD